jgi:hypothetical protein
VMNFANSRNAGSSANYWALMPATGSRRENRRRRVMLETFLPLTPEQFISRYAMKGLSAGDGGYGAGYVRIAYNPANRTGIIHHLRPFAHLVKFSEIGPPDCGASVVHEYVSVSPMLEFFIVAHLQKSGLVEAAYVDILPLSPDAMIVETRDRKVGEIYTNTEITSSEKALRLEAYFLPLVRAFITTRRPEFAQLGRIRTVKSNIEGNVIFSVFGPKLSRCDRYGWELFHLQILIRTAPSGSTQFVVQIPEGFSAPNRFDDEPNESRVRDNRMNDDQLMTTQSLLVKYLETRGFSSIGDDIDGEVARSPLRCS